MIFVILACRRHTDFCVGFKNKSAPLCMKIMLLLILISLLVALGFLCVFFWAAKDGQFEDDYTPSVRMLFDDKAEEKRE